MTLKSNSRQIPKTVEYCTDKRYHDVIYAYLQCISELDKETGERFFYKKQVKFTELAKIFGLSRQTVSVRFNNLKEIGLIEEWDNGRFKIITLEGNLAVLVPYETLKILTDALSENAISTYAYLFNRYWAVSMKTGKPTGFQVTLNAIKTHIGISANTRSNDSIVTNILFILSKLGLIGYHMTSVKTNDSFDNMKTIYEIDWVTNVIKC